MVERAKRERAWKSPHARKGHTRTRISHALVSLRKNGGLLVVYQTINFIHGPKHFFKINVD